MKDLSKMKVGESITVKGSIDKPFIKSKKGTIKKGDIVSLSNGKVSVEDLKVLRMLDAGYTILIPKEGQKELSLIDLFLLLKLLIIKRRF